MPEFFKSDDTLKAIKKLESHLKVVHVSDKSSVDPRFPLMLRLEFALPKLKDEAGKALCKEMMQLAIHLIDVCAKCTNWQNRNPQLATKVESRRGERSKSKKAHETMVERAASMKEAKAAAEKEKMENMGPEELRLYEQKKYRQEVKARQKAQGKVKKM